MSQKAKLEKILDLLINEESEKAEELLHQLVVEKARQVYEGLINEEDEEDEEMDDDATGGDAKDDFMSDIEADGNDIDSDETMDGEIDAEDNGMEDEDLDIEDKVEDLESQLMSLRAEFDQLMSGDDGMDMDIEDDGMGMDMDIEDDGMGMDMDIEDDGMDDATFRGSLGEATKLQHEVSDPGMSKEGKFVGTGKGSKTGSTFTQSPYTKAPAKKVEGGADAPVFSKGDEKGGSKESAKKETPSDNIGENPKAVNHGDQKQEGKFVGTGKGSKGDGSVSKDSVLPKRSPK